MHGSSRTTAFAVLTAILGLGASAAEDTLTAVLKRAGAFLQPPRLEQLAAGLSNAPAIFAASPCLYYPVPPCSGIPRLPKDLPRDVGVHDQVTLAATPGEIEAASFLIYALEPFKKVTLAAGPLTAPSGTLPAAAVDLRVVKCWYQGYSAWYHGVPRRGWPWKLTPELLLHDETLIDVRVETNRNVSNYIRLDKPEGPEYMWVREFAPRESGPKSVPSWAFPETLPVRDAPSIRPVTLERDMVKQFWITIRVPKQQPPGDYSGTISLTADGRPLPPLTIKLRVLPFTLPSPKTYYDTRRDFIAGFMGGGYLRSPDAKAPSESSRTEEQFKAELRNRAEHNDLNAMFGGSFDEATLRKLLRLRKECGLSMRPLLGLVGVADGLFYERGSDPPEVVAERRKIFDRLFSIVEDEIGHRDIYVLGVDEGPRWIARRQAPFWRAAHELGGRAFTTGDDAIFRESGHVLDWLDKNGYPSRELAERWHTTGGRLTMYAAPFAGPENPDLFRRRHGIVLYCNDYDGSVNYILYLKEGGGFVWDDYLPGDYRAFAVVYPTIDGLIDTLAWEGYREGLDDVRYATLMKQLAEKALQGDDPRARRRAKRALYELATCDLNCDLDALRQSFVNHILALKPNDGGAPQQKEGR